MQINTQYFDTLNLNDVEQLLPSNHHLRRFDDSVSVGLQPDGDYFVFSLNVFWGKKQQGNSCRSRITLHDVLEDCSPENRTNVDGIVHGAFCEAMEDHLLCQLGPKGTWSEQNPSSGGMWLVLHRMAVQPYQWAKKNRHPFMVVMGPSSTPQCEMWVMVKVPHHETGPATLEQEAVPSLTLSPLDSESAPQPPHSSTSTTNTSLFHPSTSFPVSTRETSKSSANKCSHSLGTLNPTSSTHSSSHAHSPIPPSTSSLSTAPAPAQVQSPEQTSSPTPGQSPVTVQSQLPILGQPPDGAQSHAEEQIPAPGSHCDAPQSSAQTKRPLQIDSLGPAKHLTQSRSSAGSPARSKTLAPDSVPGPAVASVTSTKTPSSAQAPVSPNASASSALPWKPKEKHWKLTPLVKAQNDSRIQTVGVLVEVVKEGHVARNGTIFDVLKVTAKGMTVQSSSRTHMMVKVFHNDKLDWPKGVKLQKGQVLMFKEMVCQEHGGYLDGIIFSTKRACVFSCDENKHLTWYAHSISNWCPRNIVNAESEARIQFEWWMTDGVKVNYENQGINLASKPAAVHPTCTLAQAGGKGFFNLFCQVVKKTLYPSMSNSKSVLRVCDGTCTQYCFEEIVSNPTKRVEDYNRVFGCVNSLEVDILVISSIIPSEVENLQEGSFVELKGLDCVVLPEQRRQLVLLVSEVNDYLRLLDEDEPQLQIIRDAVDRMRVEEAEAADEDNDDVSIVDSEERIPREPTQAMERFSVPHNTELPDDSFDEFVRELGYKRSSKYHTRHRGSPKAKKRCLDSMSTSGTYTHSSSTSRQSLPSLFRQPLHTARNPSPHTTHHPHTPSLWSSTSKQSTSSPQPSLSNQSFSSPSPHPSPSRLSLHSPSPRSSPLGQTHAHSSPKSSSLSSYHTHSSSPQPSTSKQHQQCSSPQKLHSIHKHTSSPQPHTSKNSSKHPSPQKSPFASRQSHHPSSPQPHQHTSPQMSPVSSRQPLYATSSQLSTAKQLEQHPSLIKPHPTPGQGPQVAPRSPTFTVTSLTSDFKDQVQKVKKSKSKHALDTNQRVILSSTRPKQPQDQGSKPSPATATSQQTVSFHTEVRNETKKTSLENFFTEGKVGKVYCVKAAITDIRTIKQRDCICGEEHVCLHQWLWGLCKKCSRTFSSYYLSLFNIPLPSDSHHHLPCQSCNHECINSSGKSHKAMSNLWSNTVKPFIKVKVEIEDPSTGLQLTPWLVADDANVFFNVIPTFEWLIDKPEMQGTVEALLQQKTPPLELGLKKVVVAGRVNLYIVNTVLFTTPSYSYPTPDILPCLQSPSAITLGPDSPSSHPDSPSAISLDSPSATTPDPDAPSTVPTHLQSVASPPHPEPLVSIDDASVCPSPPHPPHLENASHSQAPLANPPSSEPSHVNAPGPLCPPSTPPRTQSPLHLSPAISPPQPKEQQTTLPISSKTISPRHSPDKTCSIPTKNQETPSQPQSAPTTPTHTKQPNVPPQQPHSGPSFLTCSKKDKILPKSHSTPTTPTHTKCHESQSHSDPTSPTYTKHQKTPSQIPSALTTPTHTEHQKAPPQPHSAPTSPIYTNHPRTPPHP